MSVAVYARVSTTDQNLAGQRAEIQRWLTGNRIPDAEVTWYEDQATGTTMDRPAWRQLREAVFHGEVDTLVIQRLDRLSRSLKDGLVSLIDLVERGVRVVSVSQGIDFSGSVGQMIGAVLLGVSQMEHELRRERQSVGIAEARKRGAYRGRKPGSCKASVKQARALRKRGRTLDEIAAHLKITPRTVSRYLKGA